MSNDTIVQLSDFLKKLDGSIYWTKNYRRTIPAALRSALKRGLITRKEYDVIERVVEAAFDCEDNIAEALAILREK